MKPQYLKKIPYYPILSDEISYQCQPAITAESLSLRMEILIFSGKLLT